MESSEEIKIHRGKHSSEISHKKHEDKQGSFSEESDEQVIIKKPKDNIKNKKISVEIKEKNEDNSEEQFPKRVVYRPAKKIPIKATKLVVEDTDKYIRPGSQNIIKSVEIESKEEDLRKSIETAELPSEEFVEKEIVKPCGCGKGKVTTCNCHKKHMEHSPKPETHYVKTVDSYELSSEETPKYIESSPEVSVEVIAKKPHLKYAYSEEYSEEYPESSEIYKKYYSEEEMPKKFYEESYEEEPVSHEDKYSSQEYDYEESDEGQVKKYSYYDEDDY